MTVLSTKKLQPYQRDLFQKAGISFVDYDAIAVTYIPFNIPTEVTNAIFTSQHGVASVLAHQFPIKQCFCVGQKTKQLLEENGQKVTKMCTNSEELGHYIEKNYQKEVFFYFCGTKKREELPHLLKNGKNKLFELETYKTDLKPKKFEQKWTAILFFSPSGVASFTEANKMDASIAICIGNTTANAARAYTSNVVISNVTSVESVIKKAIDTIKL